MEIGERMKNAGFVVPEYKDLVRMDLERKHPERVEGLQKYVVGYFLESCELSRKMVDAIDVSGVLKSYRGDVDIIGVPVSRAYSSFLEFFIDQDFEDETLPKMEFRSFEEGAMDRIVLRGYNERFTIDIANNLYGNDADSFQYFSKFFSDLDSVGLRDLFRNKQNSFNGKFA